jgi:hypothetical protein
MKTAWLAIVLLAACGKKSDDAGGDWEKRPRSTVRGEASRHGEGGISYTIDLPKGLNPDPSEVAVFYRTGELGENLEAPDVMVSLEGRPKTIDEAAKSVYSRPDDVVVRKDAIDHGFIVTRSGISGRHDEKRGWTVNVFKAIDDTRALRCRAEQHREAALGDATRAMLENICLSLQIK